MYQAASVAAGGEDFDRMDAGKAGLLGPLALFPALDELAARTEVNSRRVVLFVLCQRWCVG